MLYLHFCHRLGFFQGMVIAETKRQMHETLEMKEDEIAQLRSRLQQATAQKEELQEQKEKAEKSGERCGMRLQTRIGSLSFNECNVLVPL